MMSRRAQENLVAVVLLLLFAGFLIVGMGYSPKARLVPVPLAIASMVLTGLQLILQNVKRDFKLNVDTMELFAKQSAEEDAEEEAESTEKKSTARKELAGFGLVLAFLGLVLAVGMFPALLLYIFGYFILIGKEKWLKSLIYSVATTGVLYFLFVSLLQVPTYQGLFELF